jgi:hypothetical protein
MIMMDPIFEQIENFFKDLIRSKISKNILSRFDSTIQFRIVDQVKDQPPEWYGKGEGDWCHLEFKESQLHFGTGNILDARDWRKTTLIEVERDTIKSILEGKERAVEAFLDDRLAIGGGQWPDVLILLRLGQVHERYGDYLSSNHVKAIFKN